MKRINKAIIVMSKIVEVFGWVGTTFSAAVVAVLCLNKWEWLKYLTSVTAEDTDLSLGGFSVHVQEIMGQPNREAFVFFFVVSGMTLILTAMIFRNIYLVFKTAEGETVFSKGSTPFQPKNVKMVRQVGFFTIGIPILHTVMAVISMLFFRNISASYSIDLHYFFMGFIALALSQYFAYGVELQNEVDGLV